MYDYRNIHARLYVDGEIKENITICILLEIMNRELRALFVPLFTFPEL